MSALEARGPSEIVAYIHARDSARGRAKHLLWAMDPAKGRDLRAANRGPLPVMEASQARNLRPSMLVGAFSSEIEARPAGDLHWPERQILPQAPPHQNGKEF
jgi:hypothetical protein